MEKHLDILIQLMMWNRKQKPHQWNNLSKVNKTVLLYNYIYYYWFIEKEYDG